MVYINCVAGMLTGAVMVLKLKSYGLWLMIGLSIVFMLFNGSKHGNITLITAGGLPILLVTWLATRKQICYGRRKAAG